MGRCPAAFLQASEEAWTAMIRTAVQQGGACTGQMRRRPHDRVDSATYIWHNAGFLERHFFALALSTASEEVAEPELHRDGVARGTSAGPELQSEARCGGSSEGISRRQAQRGRRNEGRGRRQRQGGAHLCKGGTVQNQVRAGRLPDGPRAPAKGSGLPGRHSSGFCLLLHHSLHLTPFFSPQVRWRCAWRRSL